MAANLGQAFLGAGGMVPTIAQELASGNFNESRESFHDYIYSKLILGEDKGNNPTSANPNPPVFPNTNLSSSYPNPTVSTHAATTGAGTYSQASASNAQAGANGGLSGNISAAQIKASNLTTPKSLATPKPKKKAAQAQQATPSHLTPGVIDVDGLTKVKKKSHHKKKEKTNICDVCGRAFAEKYTLNRHMLTHTHIKPYSCTKCNMAFSRSDGLAKHMAAGHRRIDAHHCDVCGGTFNSEVSFEQHRREYGNTLPFVCNLCMLAFSQCCHLNYHMKSHSLNKMNESFNSDGPDDKNNAIDVSELIPDDFSPPKKDLTKDTLSSLYMAAGLGTGLPGVGKVGDGVKRDGESMGLLDPNIVIKPEIDDMPTCSESQGFDSLGALSSSTPAGTANSLASQSGHHSSSTPSYLPDTSGNLNASTSSEGNPISDIDMKKYFDIKIPNPRLSTEGGDGQGTGGLTEDSLFRCELCGKGFTRKYHMQRHVKLHTRGPVPKAHLLDWTRRPYACGVCKMGFTRQHHLTRHMLIHTGERPHSCHVCGKAFRRFTNLSLHVRTVHGAERPFKCHICGRGFPRLYSLQRHLKLHAKNAAAAVEEQLYKGFKPVGTVNVQADESKSPSYSSAANPSNIGQSPAHSRESISSEHSDDSERYDQESSAHEDSMENIDPDGRAISSPTDHRNFTRMQDHTTEKAFPKQAGPTIKRPESVPAMSGQSEDQVSHSQPHSEARLGQQSLLTPEEEKLLAQASRLSTPNLEQIRRQTPIQARPPSDFSPSPNHPNPSRQGNESMRGQNLGQSGSPVEYNHPPRPASAVMRGPSLNQGQVSGEFNQNSRQGSESLRTQSTIQSQSSGEFNAQPPRPSSTSGRFNPSNTLPSQGMPVMDLQAGRNFNEMEIREASGYSLSQRAGEGFVLPQQRIQSPHPMMNTLERPGSRSMMSQPGAADSYHQNTSASYNQQQLNLQSQQQQQQQQRASMDLSAARNTMSPAGLRDYSHNHHLDMGSSRNAMNEPPAYSHNHGVSSLQFPSGTHSLYQQQLGDNLNHMDLHPNPSSSPMPVTSHNNNIQY